MMKPSWTALLVIAGLAPAAAPVSALAGPQYTAEEIIEHFSHAPAAGNTSAKPVTRGVFIGAAGFGSEAGASAAASQGASGAAAATGSATSCHGLPRRRPRPAAASRPPFR